MKDLTQVSALLENLISEEAKDALRLLKRKRIARKLLKTITLIIFVLLSKNIILILMHKSRRSQKIMSIANTATQWQDGIALVRKPLT